MVRARATALWLALMLAPGALFAQWSIEIEAVAEDQPDLRIAVGRNGSGDMLRIHRTAEDMVEAVFELHPGLAKLASGCPSYRVDNQKPRALVSNGDMCRAEGRRVSFVLGRVDDESVNSEALLELMNGSRIRFIYHLRGVGYEETGFSLSGSKQAINDVLGGNVTVRGD